MNKDLYNSAKGEVEIPTTLRDHLKKSFQMVKNADENTEGFNRNKELQDKNFIEYKQLKDYCKTFDLKGHTPAWCNDKNGLKMNKLEKIIGGNYFCCRECNTPMTFINKKIDVMYFYFSSNN